MTTPSQQLNKLVKIMNATPNEKNESLLALKEMIDIQIQQAKLHDKPSPDTLRMFDELKKDDKEAHDLLFSEIQEIKKSLKEIQEKLDGYPLIKNAVIGAIVVICMGVFSTIGAMMYWFLGKIKIL